MICDRIQVHEADVAAARREAHGAEHEVAVAVGAVRERSLLAERVDADVRRAAQRLVQLARGLKKIL